MEKRMDSGTVGERVSEPDVTEYCPNCGARGTWQKCKLICSNLHCGVRIILACVD